MLSDLKIDELLDKVDSRYGLAMASAKRARQINEYTATLGLNDTLGIPGPQVHTRSQHPLSIAIEELRTGKLTVAFREEAVEEVEPPETEATAEEAAAATAATDEVAEEAEASTEEDVDTEAESTDEDQGAA
jgi:DNA-directed RNA polymerase subunit omega